MVSTVDHSTMRTALARRCGPGSLATLGLGALPMHQVPSLVNWTNSSSFTALNVAPWAGWKAVAQA